MGKKKLTTVPAPGVKGEWGTNGFRGKDVPAEIIQSDEWADPEIREHWAAVVKQRAADRLAEAPDARLAMEIRAPEKAAKALYLLSTGEHSECKIAKALGVHRMDISRLVYHNAAALEAERKELAVKFTALASRTANIMSKKLDLIEDDEEEMAKASLRDIVIAMGIAADKGAQMAGIATTVIEHRTGPSVEEYEAIRAEARKRLAAKQHVIEAEVVHEDPQVESA